MPQPNPQPTDPREEKTLLARDMILAFADTRRDETRLAEALDTYAAAKVQEALEQNHYAGMPTKRHPCDDCSSEFWTDWVLLPHEVFNAVCPGGSGMLCFPCFIKRAANTALATLTHKDKGEKEL